ncbi:SURF1 family protein [Sphingomonas koreensis]|nr:SURF1 family protein [Sphingomonas koreensis]
MKRVPLVPTIVVAIAVAMMLWLGVWQIQRLHWKEALLARYAANEHLPEIALPIGRSDDSVLFRKASAFCLRPVSWSSEAGRNAAGTVGWRQIAHCATGAEGPGFAVQLGISPDPDAHPAWRGGKVSGFISHAPDHRPLIEIAVGGGAPSALMLVADTPAPGLEANAGPDLSAIPNNHFAYAIQWFLFAAVAVVIYGLALRRRWRGPLVSPRSRG